MNCSKMTMFVASVLFVAAGCSRSPEDAQDNANQAQQTATNKAAEASEDLSKKTAEAQGKATDDIAKAQREANEITATAQTKANEEIRAANLDIAKARNDFREWCQKQANEVDNLLDQARSAAQKLTPAARVQFDTSIHDLELRRDDLRGQVQSMESQTAAGWSDYKARIETRFDELKASIKNLPASEAAHARK